MIKFEEHEGQLFRMLEEPVPLKEKNTDVLVQFITHGVIGEYVMEHWLDCGQENAPIFVDSVDSDGDVTVFIENGNEHHCCPFPMFEIIGYPVSDGSNEWALYQMMQGEGVCHKKSPSIVYYKHAGGIRLEVRHNHVDYVSIDDWLNRADKDGWQIYKEPKPEPIFTTGDKVTDGVIDGTIIHIEDAIADVCPSTDEYKIELRNLNHISESPKQDDVEKPLRSMIAEAKAIGKNIRTYYQDIVFTPQALEACLNQGKFRWWNICNWELTTREQNYFPSISTSSDRPKPEPEPPREPDYVICKRCGGTGYEIKPEPAKEQFEVGDWVEHEKSKEQGRITYISSDNYDAIDVKLYDQDELERYTKSDFNADFRKLSPSEVIVHIGCLSGTVRRINDIYFALNPSSKAGWVVPEASIPHAMLDIPTRKLVESLLKAQEEEE